MRKKQITLRTLFVLVTLAAVGSLFIAANSNHNQGRREQLAPAEEAILREIEKAGVWLCEEFT